MGFPSRVLGVVAALVLIGAASPARVVPVEPPAGRIIRLPVHIGGRVAPGSLAGSYLRQWPGTYFETAIDGDSVLFRLGPGEETLHVIVDGATVQTLVRPPPGYYRIGGLAAGRHRLRIEIASESQAGPTEFDGFFGERNTRALPLGLTKRQIEFIGDSHTVGYGNTSAKTDCTQNEVWATTDVSLGFGPILAKANGADYRVNAISGRGVVRNYNGFAAAPLPVAYRNVLFDRNVAPLRQAWNPQLIVIALGTNDFSTPLHDGEQWRTRDDLHADFERTYVAFVQRLRASNPRAFFVLWATDLAGGEIQAEVAKVSARLRASGETRIAYVPIDKLSFASCHGHPSVADDQAIAARLSAVIDAQTSVWSR